MNETEFYAIKQACSASDYDTLRGFIRKEEFRGEARQVEDDEGLYWFAMALRVLSRDRNDGDRAETRRRCEEAFAELLRRTDTLLDPRDVRLEYALYLQGADTEAYTTYYEEIRDMLEFAAAQPFQVAGHAVIELEEWLRERGDTSGVDVVTDLLAALHTHIEHIERYIAAIRDARDQ